MTEGRGNTHKGKILLQRLRATHAVIYSVGLEGIWRVSQTITLILGALLLILTCSINFLPQTRIDTWTTDSGLPQNSITGLTQTPDGYIWLTSNDGLVRFDGVRFKVFDKSNTPEITNNRMSGAFADKSGKLWFHTEDGGTIFYEKGVFNIAAQPGELPPGSRSSFFDDPMGDVIFHVQVDHHRYQHYRYQDGKFVPFKIAGLSEDSLLVLSDREGGFWFADLKGFRLVKDGKITYYDFPEFGTRTNYEIAYEDRQGGIWLGYADDRSQTLHRVKNDRVQSYRLPSAPVSHFTEDLAGNLLLSVYTKGIYRIDKKSLIADEATANILEPVSSLDGISNISSGYLCSDREGGSWVGTEKGLVRLMPETIRYFSKREGLPEDNVYPLYEDRAGRVWAGVWNNSLLVYEKENFKTFLRTNDTYYITSLFEDRSGRLWFGKIDKLYYFDHWRPVEFTKQAGFEGEAEFSVISQDKDGNLWFGTSRGLSRYSGEQATVFTKKDGLPDDYIVAVLPTNTGRIWVGTRGGLALIENGQVKAFTVADGLSSNYIRSLYEDSEHVLWIGSYDSGLMRFKDGKFTRFTMNEGLSSNGVFCILDDNRGWLWVNSNQGIYRVSKEQLNEFADGKINSLTSIAYNKQDGLINIEGNGGRQPAGFRARDGKLWFPMAQGIAVADPQIVTSNQLPPPVLIEEIVVDKNKVEIEKFQAAIGNQSEIDLAPNQTNLEIIYTGISFINSGQVKFKYKLEGLEPDWKDVGSRRTAYYSYLPPGDYTFHVIAANRDGVWNTVGASVRIRVFPPFYRTHWFWLLSIVTGFVVAWTLYRWRMKRIARNISARFDERLAERTRMSRDLHDTFLQTVQSSKMVADDALEQSGDPVRLHQAMEKLAGWLGQAVLEGRAALHSLRTSTMQENDLAEAFRRATENDHKSGSMTVAFSVVGDARDMHPIVRDEIYRIGYEAIRNAYTHSHATTLEIDLKYEQGVTLRVSDNGIGIDPSVFETGKAGHFGIQGMRERAARIGARLNLVSSTTSGTEIILVVPEGIVFRKNAT